MLMDFGSKHKEGDTPNTMLNEMSRRLNDNTRRIRVLEEKQDNIEDRLNVVEKRLMEDIQNVNKDLGAIQQDTKTLGDRLTNGEVDIKKLNIHIKKMISRKELAELREYIELITPLTSKFITRKEVEELIREHVSFK
ncbi:MAG: hypothetical protein KAJ47_00900 [Candidatus Aenigmarchaeota archaeon]|nr:hypothetical protein [Candidatus Aenigmarchaeota archaeon]